jgi:hypothetical protein
MISKVHPMASMEEANIDGQNENKNSRLLQPEHESVEVKYMVMPFDEFLPFFLALQTANMALKHNPIHFESFWVV